MLAARIAVWSLAIALAWPLWACRTKSNVSDTSSAARIEGSVWQPRPGTSWQWQLSGTIDTSLDVAMYDVDLFDATDEVIKAIHARGAVVICYLSAGTHEDWRKDAHAFPPAVIGTPLRDWPGERWLDIRAASVRANIVARFDVAVARGCDGVEPDNVDGYTHASGFPLSATDQLEYNRFLAAAAHARGLSIGLKNDLEQVADLVSVFDWALNEQCAEYRECAALDPFLAAGKAVFQVEYGSEALAETVCPDANARGRDALIKNRDLDAWRVSCR